MLADVATGRRLTQLVTSLYLKCVYQGCAVGSAARVATLFGGCVASCLIRRCVGGFAGSRYMSERATHLQLLCASFSV
jgi:hypothetical protein